jgi:hypothetical protein
LGVDTLKKGLVIRDEFDEILNTKTKMAVLVGCNPVDQSLKFVMINSQITAKARTNHELRDRHVQISDQSYSFLTTLSHINCTQIIPRPLSKLEKRLNAGVAKVCGELTEDDLAKVIEQICLAKTVIPKDKRIVSAEFRLAPAVFEYR